jgi:large subunit ribosomal protein L30
MAKRSTKANKLRVTLVKSSIGYSIRQKRTVLALGLKRLRQTVEHEDTPVIRGMLAKVSHLVVVEE